MSAQEKILAAILEDAAAEAGIIGEAAELKAEQILNAARDEAKDYASKTVSEALLRAKSIKQNAESTAELTVRDMKLKKRHEEIEKTIAAAIKEITALPDKEYFTLLTGLAEKQAKAEAGELLVGSADMNRDLSVFRAMLEAKKVKVTVGGPAEEVSCGFMLKYGDVQYNLSLAAAVADKKEILEDRINQVLFE